MKIKTNYVHPPIPDRRHDWTAVDDDTYDNGSEIGQGATEFDAINDLMIQIFPDETESFIRRMAEVHSRIVERDREQKIPRPRELTDDEHDDDMFSQENGDGPIY